MSLLYALQGRSHHDAALEAQVVAVRRRLAENAWAQIGSDAIAWELSKLGVEAPCTRTIERILARTGTVGQRRRERPRSQGPALPGAERRAGRRRHPTPLAELPPGWPEQGRIEFIRFIRSDRRLRLLRRSIEMPETQVYRYVTAALDLSIPAKESNLLITDHHGELIAAHNIPRPGP